VELRSAAPPGRRPTAELKGPVPPGRRPTVELKAASPPAGPPPTVALPVTSAPAGYQSLLPLPGTDAGGYIARATHVATFAEGPLSPGCDELAGLRAALFSLGLDAPPASILVAGASAQAQTTVVASGLAGEFARDLAHHVLLVDANVRRPGVARLLEVDPELDLADVLESRADAAEAIVYSEADNLSALVLRADPQTGASRVSAEAFLAESAREVFAGLSDAFDYVVIDAGGVEESAAARVLAARVSGAVLVVPRGVSRERARAARSGVEGAGGRVLGVVLTDARAARHEESGRRKMHRGRRRQALRR
ncbi:MAG: P-loop NTPase family protein, partial [Planctomycetota bacterium]